MAGSRPPARRRAPPGRDRTRAAGRRARQINSKLRLRQAQARDQAQAAVLRITGELADLATQVARDAAPVLRNARRALPRSAGRRAGQLRRAVDDLTRTLRHTAIVVARPGPGWPE